MNSYKRAKDTFAQTIINRTLQKKMDSVSEDELFRVIIKMEQKPKILYAATSTTTIQRLKKTAQQAQKPVLEYLHKGLRTEVVRKYKGFWIANLIFAEVSKTELKELAKMTGVVEINEDYTLKANSFRVEETRSIVWDHIGFIKTSQVWARGYRGQNVKVAVVDTGIDIFHPELQGALGGEEPYHEGYWAEFDEDGNRILNSRPHDTEEHGTHVSGTIGGRNVNLQIGMAPEVILGHALILPEGTGTLPQVLAGLEWVAEQGFEVVNGSFGVDALSYALLEAVENLARVGVFPVFAIGNSGPGVPSAPGNAPLAESVGAFDDFGTIAQFSGGGFVEYPGYPYTDETCKIKPDITAPGVNITSAIPGGGYAVWSGSSMATPHLAGTVALLISKNPNLSIQQIKNILHQSVGGYVGLTNDPGEEGKDVRYGWGRLNALQAISLVPEVGTVCYVQGYVEGENEFVAGAELTFSGPEIKHLTTDEHGFYQGTLVEGIYQVTVQAPSYHLQSREVTMVFGEKTIANFFLEKVSVDWIANVNTLLGLDVPHEQVDTEE